MNRANFPDGHDIYQEDLIYIQDNVETELNKRLQHLTAGKGVGEGLTVTAQTNQVTIAAGQAYTASRFRIVVTAPVVVAVADDDDNKYIIINRITEDALSEAHPVTGVTSYRRTNETYLISIVSSVPSEAVRLGKITAAATGTVPTVDVSSTNRDILTIKSGRPYTVVAADGSGDYNTLASALTALSASGGKIYVKNGSYDLSATAVINFSNLSIEGGGPSTKIRTSSASVGCFYIHGGVGTEVSNISIENLTVEYTSQLPVVGSTTPMEPLIKIDNAVGVRLSNVTFLCSIAVIGYQSIGLSLGNTADHNAVNCIISECYFNSAHSGAVGLGSFFSFGFAFDTCAEVSGSRNALIDNRLNGFKTAGFNLTSNGTNLELSNNTIVGASNGAAVGILQGATANTNVTVGSNTVTNCRTGISIGGDNGSVVGNIVSGCGQYGMEFASTSSKFVCSGNMFGNNGLSGIRNLGSGNVVQAFANII